MTRLDRRKLLALSALGLSGLASGCDRLVASAPARNAISWGEWLSYRAQRFLIGADRLAREFSDADITKNFRANGTTEPQDGVYWKLAENQFADWKLRVGGLVEQELELSLADLKNLPTRTQITRHDCVEGWSCIGKWKGAPLAHVLDMARVRADARYAVFYCADTMEGVPVEEGASEAEVAQSIRYYESLDLLDARHPQTILAYEMNDAPLPVANGAPLRLRVERQLGYKMAKYLMRIELVGDFREIGEGRGGYWEDRGYDWYAGI